MMNPTLGWQNPTYELIRNSKESEVLKHKVSGNIYDLLLDPSLESMTQVKELSTFSLLRFLSLHY
jgi:hypothetical protein